MAIGDLACGISAMVAVSVMNNHPYFASQRRLIAADPGAKMHLYAILLLIGSLQAVGLYCLFSAFKQTFR